MSMSSLCVLLYLHSQEIIHLMLKEWRKSKKDKIWWYTVWIWNAAETEYKAYLTFSKSIFKVNIHLYDGPGEFTNTCQIRLGKLSRVYSRLLLNDFNDKRHHLQQPSSGAWCLNGEGWIHRDWFLSIVSMANSKSFKIDSASLDSTKMTCSVFTSE